MHTDCRGRWSKGVAALALCALAGAVHAQSSVSLYGLADSFAGVVRTPGASGNTWQVELLDELPATERPAPFTSQRHVFNSRPAALEWLGVVEGTAEAGEVA